MFRQFQIGLALVVDLQCHLSQGVMPQRGTSDLVIGASERQPRNGLGGQEGSVNGTVTFGGLFRKFLISATQCQTNMRPLARSRCRLEGNQRPFLLLVRQSVHLFLDQRRNVSIVEFFFLVCQLLELFKYVLELFPRQAVPQRTRPVSQGGTTAVFTKNQIGFG